MTDADRIAHLEQQLAKEHEAHQATARALVDACAARDTHADQVAALRAALSSIANNSCCAPCREAAMVARAALEGGDGDNLSALSELWERPAYFRNSPKALRETSSRQVHR